MDKIEALRILHKCADVYKQYLLNRNLMIVYADDKRECCYFETQFLKRHFKHLTGIRSGLQSTDIYNRLIKRRLSVNDFELAADGTTEQKLKILPQLLCFSSCARMVGDLHEGTVLRLHTEKLAGGVVACMGFVADNQCNGRFYVPNTALNKDIRDITNKPQHRILTILQKDINEPKYNERIYTAKGFSIDNLLGYEEICELIDFPV